MKSKVKYSHLILLILWLVIITTGITYSRYASTLTLTASNSIVVGTLEEDDNIFEIPGTGIKIPDPDGTLENDINNGEIIKFNGENYEVISKDDLFTNNNVIVIDELGSLEEASLYIPLSVGELKRPDEPYKPNIDWDVAGHVIVEPDIGISGWSYVSILSRNGNVILNDVSMIKGSSKAFSVDITANNGRIDANGIEIISTSAGDGKINLTAKDDINITDALLESLGDDGISILSREGNINAKGAIIKATNDASTAAVTLKSLGYINLERATVASKVNISISGLEGVSAQSAKITNSQWGKNISITSNSGNINLSSLAAPELQTEVSSAQGSVYISANANINIQAATIRATQYNMELGFKASGSEVGILQVENATVQGHLITVENLTVIGVLASGSIPYPERSEFNQNELSEELLFDGAEMLTKDIEIVSFDVIDYIDAGTTDSAIYIDAESVIEVLPSSVFANDGLVSVSIKQWLDTDNYDPNAAGSYTFTSVLEEIPDGYANSGDYFATIEVILSSTLSDGGLGNDTGVSDDALDDILGGPPKEEDLDEALEDDALEDTVEVKPEDINEEALDDSAIDMPDEVLEDEVLEKESEEILEKDTEATIEEIPDEVLKDKMPEKTIEKAPDELEEEDKREEEFKEASEMSHEDVRGNETLDGVLEDDTSEKSNDENQQEN